jgi:hypothetical protein
MTHLWFFYYLLTLLFSQDESPINEFIVPSLEEEKNSIVMVHK